LFTRTSPKPLLRKGGDRISPLSKGGVKRGFWEIFSRGRCGGESAKDAKRPKRLFWQDYLRVIFIFIIHP